MKIKCGTDWMGRVAQFVRWGPPGVAGLVMSAAGISPSDAASNLASWWELTGKAAPAWLATPSADHTALVVGIMVFVVWLVLLLLTQPKEKSMSVDKGTEAESVPFAGPVFKGAGLYIEGMSEAGIFIGKGSTPTFDFDGLTIKNSRRGIETEGNEED